MREYATEILYRPESTELRFLPEGPYSCGPGKLSWVAIQHGADAVTGSLNVLDLASLTNQTFELEGRPGFAWPTDQPGVFVVGLERLVRLFNTVTGEYSDLSEPVDADVEGTAINDGLVFEHGLIFGSKDLEFKTPKAGLYFWRASDRRLIRLRADQTCSNGKAIVPDDHGWKLLDIDTPTQTVVGYSLDVEAGTLGEPHVVLDLRARQDFPDGMIVTPDGESVIIAFYNPHDVAAGQAVQFNLQTGQAESVWTTERSPRVTCPQLVRIDGAVKIVLTTAAENMTPGQVARHTNAGCLFVGDTDFEEVSDQPVFALNP